MMITDALPRKANHRAGFLESDRIRTLDLPLDECLRTGAKSIESVMNLGTSADVRRACADFLTATCGFYRIPACGVRVLAARPLRVSENWSSELFGDYTPQTMLIRVWMRTAVRKEVTSFGTFLSTLCHEFCHHLDFQRFGCVRTHGTLAASTSAPPRCTTTCGGRRRSVYSGWQYRVGVGGSTGRARIARHHPS
jgi:hypothetical protein